MTTLLPHNAYFVPLIGIFSIKNKESGKFLRLKKDSLVSASEFCGITDTFIWEPQADGAFGAIKSVITDKVLAPSPKFWQKSIYLYDQDSTSELQKWRIYGGMLVTMKTLNHEPAVLSHDPAKDELLVEEMICDKEDLHWEFISQEASISGKAPTGSPFFCIE